MRIYPLYWIVLFFLGGWKVLADRMEIGDFLSNTLFFFPAGRWSSRQLDSAYEMLFYTMSIAFIVRRSLGLAVFAAWFDLVALNHFYHFATLIGFQPAQYPVHIRLAHFGGGNGAAQSVEPERT
ncbi:MAG: hypothetical protein IPK02_10350 [Candidatus Accumulibacter sp.]|uniref:Uncharacterized protein n=1 Tax=Candidatus Accumulibacter affinis TaxID=2954384 RepID=A0A935T7A6_9PROT|nr:hypothetical protein [Candidatus Accumulibacter affinis]